MSDLEDRQRFPRRINMSMVLSEGVLDSVMSWNKILTSQGSTEVNFGYPAYHIPHLTMLMGRVATQSDLLYIASVLCEESPLEDPLRYSTSVPYVAAGSRFVFVDATPVEEILARRRALMGKIEGRIVLDHHGGVDNNPHITVGYLSNTTDFEALTLMEAGEGMARELQLCESGHRGVCVRRLW